MILFKLLFNSGSLLPPEMGKFRKTVCQSSRLLLSSWSMSRCISLLGTVIEQGPCFSGVFPQVEGPLSKCVKKGYLIYLIIYLQPPLPPERETYVHIFIF